MERRFHSGSSSSPCSSFSLNGEHEKNGKKEKKITPQKSQQHVYLYKNSTRIQSAEKGNAPLAVNVFFFSFFLGLDHCVFSPLKIIKKTSISNKYL